MAAEVILDAGWIYVGDIAAINNLDSVIAFQANLATILVRVRGLRKS